MNTSGHNEWAQSQTSGGIAEFDRCFCMSKGAS